MNEGFQKSRWLCCSVRYRFLAVKRETQMSAAQLNPACSHRFPNWLRCFQVKSYGREAMCSKASCVFNKQTFGTTKYLSGFYFSSSFIYHLPPLFFLCGSFGNKVHLITYYHFSPQRAAADGESRRAGKPLGDVRFMDDLFSGSRGVCV